MAMDKAERIEIFKILLLCLVWYTVSSCNNVVGKMLLNEFPYPMSVTMVQLLSITVYSGPILKLMGVRRQTDITYNYYKRIVLPLALGKFLASLFSHVSLWKVPVSYAHTVKATMPFFTVLLSRLCFGEKQTTRVYLSLFPIILGVAIATVTELSFDLVGLAAALTATCGFSLQNIFSKKVLNDTGIHPLRLLHLLGRLALLMFLPVWLLHDGYSMLYDIHLAVRRSGLETTLLLITDGALNWLQNLIAFSILHRVAPLTYAVANATKRVAVISVSLLVLANPVTAVNVLGMMLSILGVLAYNKAKYDANKALKRSATAGILPLTSFNTSERSLYNDALSTKSPSFGPLQYPVDLSSSYRSSHFSTLGYSALTTNGHIPTSDRVHGTDYSAALCSIGSGDNSASCNYSDTGMRSYRGGDSVNQVSDDFKTSSVGQEFRVNGFLSTSSKALSFHSVT